jgi:hypothetical protein
LRVGVRVTGGWTNDRNFLRREDSLAKRILAITLTKRAMLLDGHADEKKERVTPENRRKFIQFGPNSVLVVAKNNYA